MKYKNLAKFFILLFIFFTLSFALDQDEKNSQFFGNVSVNNLEQVKLMISAGVDVNTRNDLLDVPLLYAKTPEMIKLLLDNGSDINIFFIGHKTLLMRAIETNNNNLAEVLIDRGISLNAVDNFGELAFTKAYNRKNYKVLKKLIAKGYLKEILKSPYKDFLFEGATQAGNEELVQEALNTGFNINSTSNYGQTLLISSILNNNISLSVSLINKGARTDIIDNYGKTALNYAVENGSQDLIKKIISIQGVFPDDLLISAYDDKTIKFIDSQKKYSKIKYQDFLIKAIDNKNKNLIDFIMSRPISVNYQDNNNKTALIAAVQANNLPLIKSLLKRGADPNLMDNNKNTALVYAGDIKIIELLLSNEALLSINNKDKKESILNKAVSQDNKILIEYLTNPKKSTK